MVQSSSSSKITVIDSRDPWSTIAEDVRNGLSSDPKTLPCKYFYDKRGSLLFDQISRLPEYYLTRTETGLLESISAEIVKVTQAREIIELGSGIAVKTTLLLDAFLQNGKPISYIPLDISESALKRTVDDFSRKYDNLEIRALACDYTSDLLCLTSRGDSLAIFLGSTIGNFDNKSAIRLLNSLKERLVSGDWFLLGVDLLKSREILEAAYNDSQGITASFNKNILSVINDRLGANFNPDEFLHRAFLNERMSQVELYLEVKSNLKVEIRELDMTVSFQKGETILTEISRKFTRQSIHSLLNDSGFELYNWYPSQNEYFALALARVKAD
ncbi:L-histidine N(alpha)-methyltransferase [Acidobacteriota bacterium]